VSYQCPTCDGPLRAAQDPDEWLELTCSAERACEEPGCGVVACGDDTPITCDLCGFHFCKDHLQRLADNDVCGPCSKEIFREN